MKPAEPNPDQKEGSIINIKNEQPKRKKSENFTKKKQKTTFLRSKTNFRFPQKKFEDETLNRAINLLIYGKKLLKFCKSGKMAHMCYFYILEDNPIYLQWISKKKIYGNSRIDLTKITSISDDPTWKMANLLKRMSNLLCLTYENANQKEVEMLLKFPNEETKLFWWQGIQHFIKRAFDSANNAIDQKKLLAQKLFSQADKDGSKTLEFEETKKILQKLHIEITKDYLKHLFELYDKDKNNTIDINEFQEIIDDITQKKEVIPIFKEFCQEATQSEDLNRNLEIMTEGELTLFYEKCQKQPVEMEEIKTIIHCLRDFTTQKSLTQFLDGSKANSHEKMRISLSEFSSILFSINNSIYDPIKQEIYQPMDRPLTDYFINSSHNTYLMANQLTGESSTKAYINAFLKGVRCVELDCWDGEKGEPIIYHGFTLTSKIFFEDVIKTINDYGFNDNPYPIILSIENHCKAKQQERMAEILQKILGDKLYTLPKDYQNYEYYPSPNQLKNKVIIKDKGKLPESNEKKMMATGDVSSFNCEIQFNNEDEYINQKMQNFTDFKDLKFKTIFERYEEIQRFTPRPKPFISLSTREKEKRSTISKGNQPEINELDELSKKTPELRDLFLANKTSSMKFKIAEQRPSSGMISNDLNKQSLVNAESLVASQQEKCSTFQNILGLFGIKMNFENPRAVWNISSINEEKISKFLKERETDIIDFHRKYFTRIYPSGKRVDSSNYDPIDAFNAGAQLIALNVQTADSSLLVYFSKFLENGGNRCGYVLKPSFLLHDAKNLKYIKDFKNFTKIVNIRVISGQQLRPENENDVKDVADPYVEVSLRGTIKDETENSKVFKSIMVKNNGFNPVFELQCTFKVSCPELCFIVFKVFDQEGGLQKDTKLGWYAIPFHCIREGYRVVPLLNSNLNPIEFSYLFCYINITDV